MNHKRLAQRLSLRPGWGNDEPGPAGKKAEAADRRDGAEPANIRQRQRLETAAEKDVATRDQKIRDPIPGAVQCEKEERQRVQKMIQNGFVPDVEHSVALQRRFQSMRAECAEPDGQQTKGGGDSE